MKPQALLLDALGTLVELEAPAPALRTQLAGRCNITISSSDAERAMSAEIAYYRTHLQMGSDGGGLAILRARCAEVLRQALVPSPALSRISTSALTDVLLASLRFSVYPDVAPALLAARASGARLVVVSNWDVSLREALSSLGLTALVDGIVTSAEVGSTKPAPAIFARALELAGTDASRATHVGDSLEEDVGGARAAGIDPVLLRRGGGPGAPGVRTIESLAEL